MIKKIISKNEVFIRYVIFGILTTLLHLLLFVILDYVGIKYYIANIITLIFIKAIAYIVNKVFVFKNKCNNKKELLVEIIKYIVSRLFTMLIDFIGLILLVEMFNINEVIGKIIILIIVTIINYILCKKYVYRNSLV